MSDPSSLLPELLLRIFEHALSESGPSLTQTPLNVSHTCNYWRHVALSNGHLWAGLHCNCATDARLISLWVERSKDAMIELKMSPANATNGYVRASINGLLHNITSAQRRISSMDICVPIRNEKAGFKPAVLLDLPMLRFLRLEAPFPFLAGLVPSPSARKGRTRHLFFLSPDTITLAPCLTRLELLCTWQIHDITGTLLTLEQCPNLKEFTLRCNSNILQSETESLPPITLLNLEVFRYDVARYDGFVGSIITPRLRTLEIRTTHEFSFSRRVPAAILKLLSNSNCGPVIKTACLFFWGIDEDQQIQLLEALPSLTDLRASFPDTENVWNELRRRTNSLCPSLATLSFSMHPYASQSSLLIAMLDMLETRVDRNEDFRMDFEVLVTSDIEATDSPPEVVRLIAARTNLHLVLVSKSWNSAWSVYRWARSIPAAT